MANKAAAKKRPAAAAKKRPATTKKRAATTAKKQPAAAAKKRSAAAARALRERQRPETLRLRSLSASFTVNDLDKSLAWYRDVLGFVVGERWEDGGKLQGVQLRAGSCELYLTQDDFKKGRDRPKGIGFRLWCTTQQDIDELAERIRRAGGQLAHGPVDRSWGGRELGVTDPDGFQISISRVQ